jgi:hypothetical protein
MALPLLSSPSPTTESADPYRGITDFLNMSFDNSRETAAVGPLQIAPTPEVFHTFSAGTSVVVTPDCHYSIDLGNANRPDSQNWTVTSSNGAISFRSDAEVREIPEAPGVYQIIKDTPVSIADAEIQIQGEDESIRFSGLTAILPKESTFSLSNHAEHSLGIAA